MAGDPHRPRYHFLPPANWMNDPNGLIQWRGRYHLFYQHNPSGAVWGDIHWGHAASDDLTHWTDWPLALAPTPGGYDQDGCWSGCAVDDVGVPTLVYTGRRGEQESVCVATSRDDLLTWQKEAHNPVVAGPPPGLQTVGFRDPYVWREGDTWKMVIGSGLVGQGGAVLLYQSPDLRRWRYLGPLLVGEAARHGLMWECPNFLPLGNSHVLILSSIERQRVLYFIGEYRDHQFHPRQEGVIDAGYFYAPQVMLDEQRRPVMFGWLKEGRSVEAQRAAGWAGVQSLPRVLSLGPDSRLMISPAPELAALRGQGVHATDIVVSPGAEYAAPVRGDCLEIMAEFDAPPGACGLRVLCAPDASEETVVTFDPAAQSITLNSERASLAAESDRGIQQAHFHLRRDEPLVVHLYLDRSVVEVFVNDRHCLTGRVYPTSVYSLGVRCFVLHNPARLRSLQIWPLRSI